MREKPSGVAGRRSPHPARLSLVNCDFGERLRVSEYLVSLSGGEGYSSRDTGGAAESHVPHVKC